MEEFRRIVELKYRLMPYVYAQAKLCSQEGYPMIRTLFFEYPEDLVSWFIGDEYLFGEDVLVAPLMEDSPVRDVYLPPGTWIDYQTAKAYEGAKYHRIRAGEVPIVMLVRERAAIPRLSKIAQSTAWMDWQEMELAVFCGDEATVAEGKVCLPDDGELQALRLEREGDDFVLKEDPLRGRVQWRIQATA